VIEELECFLHKGDEGGLRVSARGVDDLLGRVVLHREKKGGRTKKGKEKMRKQIKHM